MAEEANEVLSGATSHYSPLRDHLDGDWESSAGKRVVARPISPRRDSFKQTPSTDATTTTLRSFPLHPQRLTSNSRRNHRLASTSHSCPALFANTYLLSATLSHLDRIYRRRKLGDRRSSRSCCYLPDSRHDMPPTSASATCNCDISDVLIKLNGCVLDECQRDGGQEMPAVVRKTLSRYRSFSMPFFDVENLPTFSNCSSRNGEVIPTVRIDDCVDWGSTDGLNLRDSAAAPLIKSVSTPEITSAETPSPLPEGRDLIDLCSDSESYVPMNTSSSSKNNHPTTPPTHVMIRELLAKYQSHHLLGLNEGKEDNVSVGQRISLTEALNDLPVTAKTTSTSRTNQQFPLDGTASLPRLSTSSSLLLRKKSDKKYKPIIRRSSKIFNIGSKSKKSKEEMKRCQQTHSFVSVSFSNAAPCQLCGKPLAHKAASQCQNCLLACHDNSACFDLIEACLSPAGTATNLALKGGHERSSSLTLNLPLSATSIPAVFVDSSLDKVMMDVHGYAANNVRQQDVTTLGLFALDAVPAPNIKRLSVPASFESQASALASAHSECSLSASSPATSRRPISPGSFSRWKSVADKLLNKPSSTESHADYDSPAEDNSTADNPPDGRDILSHARLLDFDVDLKLATLEAGSWTAMQDKEYLATLSSDEIKRQDIIHELIQTEKTYCTVLLIIDQIYIRGMRHKLGWSEEKIQQLFPSLPEILEVHIAFFRQLRARQQRDRLVTMISDVLIDQFSGERGEEMKRAYAIFCSLHKAALKKTKEKLKEDKSFREFHSDRIEQLKCKSGTFDIPSCILLVTQRITKYPILVESIHKKTKGTSPDKAALIKAQESIKDVLTHVDQAIGIEERRERLAEIYKCMEPKTFAVVDKETWRKHNLHERILLYEGTVHVRSDSGPINPKKPPKDLSLLVLLFSDCIVFLQEKNQKFFFAQFDDEKPPITLLRKVVRVRPRAEKGGKEKAFYIIALTEGDEKPLMYELTCGGPKDSEKWQAEIEAARAPLKLGKDGLAHTSHLDDELAIDELQILKIREIIASCQDKDSLITQLCQEKCGLMEKMMDCARIPRSHMHLPPLLTISEENMATEQTQLIIKAALMEVDRIASLPCAFSPTSDDDRINNPDSQMSSGNGDLFLLSTSDGTSPGPRRHGTFNGFDGSKEAVALSNASRSTSMKDQNRARRPPHLTSGGVKSSLASTLDKTSSLGVSSLISSSRDSCGDYSSSSAISSSPGSSPRASTFLPDESQTSLLPSVLQLRWYLNQLSDAVSRQSTAFESLNAKYSEGQQRLAVLEARDKKLNKHSAQLEELRNLQEAFIKEKNQYFSEREVEAQDLKWKRQVLDKDAAKLKIDTEDVEKQRNAMFVQCEKLRESGLEVKLSTTAPYVQIFQCQPAMQSVSAAATLPPPPQFEDHKPPHAGSVNHLTAGMYLDGTLASRGLPPFAALSIDHRTRPLLASSQSLNPIRIPVAPPMPLAAPPSIQHHHLRLPPNEAAASSKQHSTFSMGNWKGSIESLVQKTGASAKDKIRSLYEGQDKTDALPRPNIRSSSEAKLGISNLMHLSEKTSAVAGKENGQISPADTKKKSSDKKRTFL